MERLYNRLFRSVPISRSPFTCYFKGISGLKPRKKFATLLGRKLSTKQMFD